MGIGWYSVEPGDHLWRSDSTNSSRKEAVSKFKRIGDSLYVCMCTYRAVMRTHVDTAKLTKGAAQRPGQGIRASVKSTIAKLRGHRDSFFGTSSSSFLSLSLSLSPSFYGPRCARSSAMPGQETLEKRETKERYKCSRYRVLLPYRKKKGTKNATRRNERGNEMKINISSGVHPR